MSHRLPLADIQFISDFAVYARGRGEVAYNYCEPSSCALAQFLTDTDRAEHASQPCGVHKPYGMYWWPTDATPLYRALNRGDGYTFSALADRLEALLVDSPAVVSQS